MNRFFLSFTLLVTATQCAFGQESTYDTGPTEIISEGPLEVEDCCDPWARFHGFIFRRYAGSVEMESKQPYPKGYFGRFTYLPWKPDWVNTPANRIRASQYRHHQVHPMPTLLRAPVPMTIDPAPSAPEPARPLNPRTSSNGLLQDVRVESVR